MSFAARLRFMVPLSPKIVGHGLVGEQVPPLVTIVSTSETRFDDPVPLALGPPRVAVTEFTTSITGARLLRTTSPQETVDATSATAARTGLTIRILFIGILPLPFDDARRDEDQQLAAAIEGVVTLEQPVQQWNAAEPGRAIRLILLVAQVDAADDGRLTVVDLDG